MDAVVATRLEHEKAQELFGLFVDQELAPSQQQALLGHLDSCAECKQELERYARTVAAVRSLEREQAPKDLAARVLKRVRRRRRSLLGIGGTRVFEHFGVPVEVAVPVVLIAIAAAIVLLTLQ